MAATRRNAAAVAAVREGARFFFRRAFVSLLLDYSHAIGPFSLDFRSCAVCFKGKWAGLVHIDARTRR